ncbi:MAG TPA: hypothetical protein PLT66_06850, partial [Bacillota bacterium]|nr:hypothetical protein [Bacillota bacterium]
AEEFTEQYSTDETELIEIPEEVFKDLKFEKTDDGKKLTVLLDSEKYATLILDSYGDALSEFVVNASNINLNDTTIELLINKDGYLSVFRIVATATVAAADSITGVQTSVSIDTTVTYNAPGTDVSVEAPSDLQNYTEMFDFGDIDWEF